MFTEKGPRMSASCWQRWNQGLAVLALLALSLPGVPAAPPSTAKRPLTVEDLWKVKRVGPPSVAPDGQWAAVEVTTFDMDKDESTSQIWLLSTDGQRQRQLTSYP